MQENQKFPTLLKLWKYEIERQTRRFGLSHRPIIYEIVDFEEMSEVVARNGFPTVPHHWRYGQSSIYFKANRKLGLSTIYELVVNTDPIYAFLLECNSTTDMKAVMAHVTAGHADLFDRNIYCRVQNKNMLSMFGNDATWLEEQYKLHGPGRVKRFYDEALSLENLIDIHRSVRLLSRHPDDVPAEVEEEMTPSSSIVRRIEPPGTPSYMNSFLNPPAWIETERKRLKGLDENAREIERGLKIPSEPTKDVIGFMVENAPLEEWQRGILAMVRRYTEYFTLMARTKLIHEGWAAYWEEKIMHQPGMLNDDEFTAFNSTLANVQRNEGFNPYRLGYDLIKDIEYRWETGRHGKIYNACKNIKTQECWDEFMVYKQLKQTCTGNIEFTERWNEFSAFVNELRTGKLGYPKMFFERDFLLRENLIPAWLRYQRAEIELLDFKSRLEQTLEIEKRLETVEVLLSGTNGKNDNISLREHMFKARRDLFIHEKREDLWAWTSDELKREINALNALVSFGERWRSGEITFLPLPILETWDELIDMYPKPVELGVGQEKLFHSMAVCDDVTFLDEFFTKDFCERHFFYLYKSKDIPNKWSWAPEKRYILESREYERIKRRLIFMYQNMNSPVIEVVDGNYMGRGELYLRHVHSGVDLDMTAKDSMYFKDVFKRIFKLWGNERSVHLETIVTKQKDKEDLWRWGPILNSEKKATLGKREMLKGKRILVTYGPAKKAAMRDFIVTEIETVEFPEPF